MSMEFNSLSDDEQLQRGIQDCQPQLPPSPNNVMWQHFFLSLYIQVITSEENEKRKHKYKVWDFCVIHSSHSSDCHIARHFVRLLETSLGINGKCLEDVALGENTLEAASTMVQGSSKVFVLVSKHLEHESIPKFVFQETLMQQLQRPDWRCKIVPMYLPGPPVRPPFFMANIQGLKLGEDTRTVELVSGAITLEEQMQVRAIRNRDQIAFRARLKRLRQQRFQEIRDVIVGLRKRHGDDYDPSEQTVQLNSITTDFSNLGGEANQIINISGCQGVSVGSLTHYHGDQDNYNPPSSSSNSRTTPSSASTDLVDSSIYFNPSSSSNPSTYSTVSTLLKSDSMTT